MVALILLVLGLAIHAEDRPAPPGRLVNVNGRRVHLYCTGSGSPTVVVAGGGFSIDWGLIQPRVAASARICTYDPAGSAWSDPTADGSPLSCSGHVEELEAVLRAASLRGPFVVAGYSIGGLYARLFAAKYPELTAGMVIVDHAFDAPPAVSRESAPMRGLDSAPSLISQTPLVLGIEDDANFARLAKRNRDWHRWAMSLKPARPDGHTIAECTTVVESATHTMMYPLDSKPLVVIRTRNDAPGYQPMQAAVLRLSKNSMAMTAEDSGHMVIVDQPDVIVSAIQLVVKAIRTATPLSRY